MPSEDVDVVVVGAGFAGMYALHRLRQLELRVRVFEAASDVGGTWWWNRYPGARCDIESWDYSYSFDDDLQQEWEWTERYAAQPEILDYANHVADRYELRRDIKFDTKVTASHWNDDEQRWRVSTDRGDRVSSRFVIMATGPLSVPKDPEIDGIETYTGAVYHTGRWPHEGVDFTDQRVGIIGTGSSGIQSIPHLAEQAEYLWVFQRTPNFTMPAKNTPLDQERVAERKADYAEYRRLARQTKGGILIDRPDTPAFSVSDEERQQRYDAAWESGLLYGIHSTYSDLMVDEKANETAAEFVRQRIHEIVDDSETAELLSPRGHPFGTKRPCLDTDYYATYNRDDITLVDIRSAPIVGLTPNGLRTTEAEYDLDAIVFATGFDAMTGPLLGPDIVGTDGVSLREKWADGPHTYLGLMTAGFPNLFLVNGPQSPAVLVNMILAIEHHVDWITSCIEYLDAKGFAAIDPTPEDEDKWVDLVRSNASVTLYPKANSWWMGANVPGKPRTFLMFIGGFDVYSKICDDAASNGYDGFTLARAST